MSFVSTLRHWDEAVACVEKKDTVSALRIFLDIEEKTSKINFNIGCLHLNNNELDDAEKVKKPLSFGELLGDVGMSKIKVTTPDRTGITAALC